MRRAFSFAFVGLATSASTTTASDAALTNTVDFNTIYPDPRPARFGPTEGLWRSFIEKHYPTLREATGGGGGGRFCDIGAADGSLTAYIAGNLGMNASAYDIMSPDENKYSQIAGSAEIGKTQTAIELFDGQHIPQPDSGCTITLFAYVLHHAAEKTFRLLTEALRVTPPHGYLMLAEDLAEPTNAERSARNLLHDTHGTFRTDAEWSAMLDVLGFELLESGSLFGDENPQHYYIARPRNPLAAIESNAK